VADPEAAAYEVEQVQREISVRIAEAQTARAAAERDAREQRRRIEQETEQRARADDAAEEALRDFETVRAETAERIGRITADADARFAEHQARTEQAATAQQSPEQELQRVRAQAADRSTSRASAGDVDPVGAGNGRAAAGRAH
jgi:colicin import membrane protein